MSRPCPGGCGHRLYDCCDQAIGEPHQTRCRARATRAVRVDGRPLIHKAYLEARFDDRQLRCVGGCDLSGAVCYDFVDDQVVSHADVEALCQAWSMPISMATRVATPVPTPLRAAAGEDDPMVDHVPVTK